MACFTYSRKACKPRSHRPLSIQNCFSISRTAAICYEEEDNWTTGVVYAPNGGCNYADDDNFLTGSLICESITMIPKESIVGFDAYFLGAYADAGGGTPSVMISH